jgi:CxxC-x17-CxxC domain-containing protein
MNDGEFREQEKHKATCSDCGEECEVPFKPTEGRPVYCRDCFRKSKKF